MTPVLRTLHLWLLLAAALVAGCAVPAEHGPAPPDPAQIEQLSRRISGLGPQIDPDEARRAARIAYEHTYVLARQYRITDPPLVHNTKVNLGLRPRGLCWHWAEDLEQRMRAEGFRTLSLHRAIANSDNAFRIEHSTLIVSAAGDGMFDGVVLDPWRKGGRLTWVATRQDPDYDWKPREQVFATKRARARTAQVARAD